MYVYPGDLSKKSNLSCIQKLKSWVHLLSSPLVNFSCTLLLLEMIWLFTCCERTIISWPQKQRFWGQSHVWVLNNQRTSWGSNIVVIKFIINDSTENIKTTTLKIAKIWILKVSYFRKGFLGHRFPPKNERMNLTYRVSHSID